MGQSQGQNSSSSMTGNYTPPYPMISLGPSQPTVYSTVMYHIQPLVIGSDTLILQVQVATHASS